MKTVTFWYTEGVSYKATNVENVVSEGSNIEYIRTVQNESGTIVGNDFRSISTEDLLFATVKDHSTGMVTIIPGIYEQFDVVPKGHAVTRQQNIEREAAAFAANRKAKEPERKAKEIAKFEARRAARKAEWVEVVGEDDTKKSKENESAIEQLRNAGVSDSDIEVLKSLKVVK